ncbi:MULTISPECIES: Clp protease N-terminal domain-containing protein [unclassified Streptomyces]|uniref:Clp protease N-terminal domain-containing protein n=1 Tax=unclassified Streptomyces TaxID=2593676 RepID=UPI000DB9D0CE|nr:MULTISPECIES: Clp protease N-terminal domain-containing protein [unclassified Streptomyces]MYT75847.1 peptidase [Streptomyces sp. SID8367]RAJ77675.1 ClpA/ClpB-like protein [Streptomyces sp. PsTaAH-137]
MFERFTEAARAVVKGAVVHAERERAERVDEGHLLLALLERRGSRGAFVLDALGLADEARRAEIGRAVGAARRRAGLSRADTEALAGLGIDVDEIVARVEEAHGVGALAGGRRVGGRRAFTGEAKKVLEGALRVAVRHGDRSIGDEHVLLALVSRGGSSAAEVLEGFGVGAGAVERVLYGGYGGEGRVAG